MRREKVKKQSASESKYFRGEVMICEICGTRERSNPHVSSNWNVIEMDGHAFYVCPSCFGKAQSGGK